jgi:hypothetical protein
MEDAGISLKIATLKAMPYYAFSPNLVSLFNQATYDQSWCEDTWALFLSESKNELSVQSAYFLNDSDQHHHERLVKSLSDFSNTSPNDLAELLDRVQATAGFVQGLGELRQNRETLNFVKIPELDRLITATIATLQGRGQAKALPALAESALRKTRELASTFDELRQDLSVEVQTAISAGFTAAKAGFQALERAIKEDTPGELERAAVNLKDGGELLEHLQTWEQQYRASISFRFPCAGFEAVELLKRNEIEAFQSGPLQELLEFWATTSEMLIVAEKDLELLANIDQILARLGENTHQEHTSLCRELEAHFDELNDKALAPGTTDNPWDRLAQFLSVALVEGVPDLLVLDMASNLRESSYAEFRTAGDILGKEVTTKGIREALTYLLQTSAPDDLLTNM